MTPIPDAATPLPTGRLEGRVAFADAVRLALHHAALSGWSQILFSDPDFADWPLGESAVVDALQAWAGRGRRLRLLARDFSVLRLQQPRFVRWRVNWGHVIEAHGLASASDGEVPSAIWTPDWSLERLDLVRCTAVATRQPDRHLALKERLEQVWAKGRPAFAATTLGL
ncbi:hypothetical protein [Hydrogenophaga sp.]|uniref:hypothetical protein n=1 Tax=Hydrogenophaga sp. TaxID=1904254 RepID=UPI0035619E9E